MSVNKKISEIDRTKPENNKDVTEIYEKDENGETKYELDPKTKEPMKDKPISKDKEYVEYDPVEDKGRGFLE